MTGTFFSGSLLIGVVATVEPNLSDPAMHKHSGIKVVTAG